MPASACRTTRRSSSLIPGGRLASKTASKPDPNAACSASPVPGLASSVSVSRSRTVALSPAPTVSRQCAASLVPTPAGLTASVSVCTTYRPMPSLTYGVAFGLPKIRSLFVSLSVNSSGASWLQYSQRRPSTSCSATTTAVPGPPDPRCSRGVAVPPAHDQVCRNHSVGSRCKAASCLPRLCTVTCTSTSSHDALPYSTTMS